MQKKTITETESSKNIPGFLDELKPQETTIYSDLTGTLMFQKENGFPESQKEQIKDFLNNNGRLIIVTGDALEIVKEKFLAPLKYLGSNPLYLITGSGYSIDVFFEGQLEHFHTGYEIPPFIRERILFSVLQQIGKTFACETPLTEIEQKKLLSNAGSRINMGRQNTLLPNTLHLEVRPNKITVFFLENNDAPEQADRLLENIASNTVINNLISEKKYIHITKGHNFIDIITCKKEQGIKQFNKILSPIPNTINRKNILLLGDSINDAGLFNYPFSEQHRIFKVYLGNDEAFFESINVEQPNNYRINLNGAYIQGSQEILKKINDNAPKHRR